jgi:hypothetical protein
MGGVRLSRPRVLVRVALLVLGGAYMLWHALELRRGTQGLEPAEALLRDRFALLWTLVAVVAFATAAVALLSLRSRPRRRSLHLDRGEGAVPGERPPPTRGRSSSGSAPDGSTQ